MKTTNTKKKANRKPVDRDELYQLYIIDNLTKAQCADILGYSEVTIKNYLRKYDIHKTWDNVLERKRLNCLDKYGEINWMKTDKYRKAVLQRWESKSEDDRAKIVDKREKTNLEKYGVKNTFQLTNWEEIYGEGVTSPFCIDEVRDKSAKSLFEHYGVINAYESPTVKKNNRYIKDGIIFDSFPELALWVYAKDHNEDIYRDHKIVGRFIYYYKGKKHYYYPDFLYNGELLEIKGLQFFRKDGTMYNPYDDTLENAEQAEEKHKCMLNNGVKIWTINDYTFALDYFNANYNKLDYKLEVS